MIDRIDLKILNIIQNNAQISNVEIARQLDMAPSAIFKRIKRLEEEGIIKEYVTHLNPKKLGLGLVAFVFVRADEGVGGKKTANSLAKIPEVLEVHHIAGEDCFLVKVRAQDTEELGKLLSEKIGAIKTIRSTRTTIVMGTVKETSRIPLNV